LEQGFLEQGARTNLRRLLFLLQRSLLRFTEIFAPIPRILALCPRKLSKNKDYSLPLTLVNGKRND